MANPADQNPFEILGVKPGDDDRQVRAAWAKVAKECHPDRNSGDPMATEQFRAAQQAYEAIKTPELRRTAARHWKPPRDNIAEPGIQAAFERFYRAVDANAASWPAAQSGLPPKRGPDIRRRLTVTLEQIHRGATISLAHSAERCRPCEGTGRLTEDETLLCPRCLGKRTIKTSNGFVWSAQTCETCNGRGRVSWIVCAACGGGGQLPASAARIDVPPGAAEGMEIILPGLGVPGTGGGPPGDLVAVIATARHPVFTRNGYDVSRNVDVHLWDAALGCRLHLQGVDGTLIDVSIAPGTQPGAQVILRGAGLPKPDGGRGNLNLTVKVTVPAARDGDMRELFEAMKSRGGSGK